MIFALLLAAAQPHRPVAHPGPFCGTRWSRHILADPEHRPLPKDPWVRWYLTKGAETTLRDAQITRADNVVNGCD
jgi:hypothetical protein